MKRLTALGFASFVACSSSNPATPEDGGTDAPADVAVDTNTGDDGGSTCAPAPLTNYTIPAYVPPAPGPGACNNEQIAAYYRACWDGTNPNRQSDCAAFKDADAGNTACLTCMESKSSDSAWGAIVIANNLGVPNIATCIAVADPSQLDCAHKVEGEVQCQWAACNSNCPVTDQASADAWNTCVDQATTTQDDSTATVQDKLTCLAAISGTGSPAAKCIVPTTKGLKAVLDAIAPILCGGGSSDAGGGG
jgi:hypothetical protein